MPTVPICDDCWRKEKGEREPIRMKSPCAEICYDCGHHTYSGIYVRRSKTHTSYTCPRCGMTSHNLHDAKHRYCGNCHQFEYP